MEPTHENHHYHIRWSGKDALDWESFGSIEEAEASAKQLVRLDETYTIEQHDQTCPRCRAAFGLKLAHRRPRGAVSEDNSKPIPKYPWHEAVLDASKESRSEFLPGKVNAAQRAIAARLCDQTPAGLEEQIAIRDALNFLGKLLSDRTAPEEESGSKAQTA